MRYLMSEMNRSCGILSSLRRPEAGQEHASPLRITGSFVGAWLSLVERFVRDEEVAGSNPVAPIVNVGLARPWLALYYLGKSVREI
jgi:hypothetical protein